MRRQYLVSWQNTSERRADDTNGWEWMTASLNDEERERLEQQLNMLKQTDNEHGEPGIIEYTIVSDSPVGLDEVLECLEVARGIGEVEG